MSVLSGADSRKSGSGRRRSNSCRNTTSFDDDLRPQGRILSRWCHDYCTASGHLCRIAPHPAFPCARSGTPARRFND